MARLTNDASGFSRQQYLYNMGTAHFHALPDLGSASGVGMEAVDHVVLNTTHADADSDIESDTAWHVLVDRVLKFLRPRVRVGMLPVRHGLVAEAEAAAAAAAEEDDWEDWEAENKAVETLVGKLQVGFVRDALVSVCLGLGTRGTSAGAGVRVIVPLGGGGGDELVLQPQEEERGRARRHALE